MKLKKIVLLTQIVDREDPILGFMVGWILECSRLFDEVHVICLKSGEYDFPAHVHVYSLGKERGVSKLMYVLNFYKHFGTLFFKVKPQYILFHMGAIFNILAAPFFLLRSVVATKFMWWKAHGHINWMGKLALCFVDEVVTSTASGFPLNTKKRRIIGQAIDTNLFCLTESVERNPKEVLYVGRVMPIKQLEVFIETARILEPQGFTFRVVGPAGDISYYEGLKQMASDTNIVWEGSCEHDELPALYQQAGFFLNTSLTHSLDKTVLEAMLCGCIPVTANKSCKDLLTDTGLYIEEQSAPKYATIMSGLAFAEQSELRSSLANKVEKAHALKTFPERIFSNYQQ